MKHLPTYDHYLILEFFDQEFALLEYEEKDLNRVIDILKKSKGSDDKIRALITRMANSITDKQKAYRRGEAVDQVTGGEGAEWAKIFYDRAEELGLDVASLRRTAETKLGQWEAGQHGRIFLPTWSAAAVWEHEIIGQMSDGAWENDTSDHWKFWNGLDVAIGQPKVDYNGGFYGRIKTGYNLAGLLQYVGDRMVNIGRLGMALKRRLTDEESSAAENMPKTLEEFISERSTDKYLMRILPGDAEKYYATKYELRDLKEDLQSMKAAMKTVPSRY